MGETLGNRERERGAGSLTVQKECLTVYVGGGLFSDTCHAIVFGGSDTYEDAHGAGTCTGLINLVTGIASQSCELRLTPRENAPSRDKEGSA